MTIKKWLDGSQIMDRWGLNTFELTQLIFDEGLKAFDVSRGDWVTPDLGPYAWMAGPGAYLTRFDLGQIAQLPLEKQKDILSKLLQFDSADIEHFEKDHPELLNQREERLAQLKKKSGKPAITEPKESSDLLKVSRSKDFPDPKINTVLCWWIKKDSSLKAC